MSANTQKIDEELKNKNAKFVLLFFREDCYNEFWKLNIFHEDCISITISKGLGYGIIIGAALVKAPQVFNIVLAKSGKGILASMFYMECFMHIISGCYNIHLASPFSVYGENFCLLVQNILLIVLLWVYERRATTDTSKVIISFIIVNSLLILWLDIFVPEYIWKLLMNIQIFMVAYSRIPQILENHRTKFTGELSSVMFLLNTLGNLARTFTFIKETQDLLNIFTSGLSAILNFSIFIQILLYWKNGAPNKESNELRAFKHEILPKDVETDA